MFSPRNVANNPIYDTLLKKQWDVGTYLTEIPNKPKCIQQINVVDQETQITWSSVYEDIFVSTLADNCGIMFIRRIMCGDLQSKKDVKEVLKWLIDAAKYSPYNYIQCGTQATQNVVPILNELGFKHIYEFNSSRTRNDCIMWLCEVPSLT